MNLRRWLYWLLLIGFSWLVIHQFNEIEKITNTLAQGQWQWVMGAAALLLLYYTLYARLYQLAFATVGIASRLRDLLAITFASIFINATTPTAGTTGFALFIDDARRRGHSAPRS